jgi:3-hydroxyacyl-[acyl-carrier-protein] dehydratase
MACLARPARAILNGKDRNHSGVLEARRMLSFTEIQKILPHRYPFLLVDRVTEISDDKIIGYKNITGNEPFFAGHFPGYPVMPGVLIVEACAQLGAVMLLQKPDFAGKLAFLTGLDGWRFRRQVVPGDMLTMEVTSLQLRSQFGKSKAEARVNGELAASGEIIFAIGPANAGS